MDWRFPSESRDQRGSDFSELRYGEAKMSEVKADQISEWSCSMSIKDTAQRIRERSVVALSDEASCSLVKTGWKL